MHPLLLKIGSVPIHTYGFMIAIGFLIALYVIKRLAHAAKLDEDRILDLTFWAFLVGFLGARILFILTRLDYFLNDPMEMIRVWEGGLVFYGGPLLAAPFVIWYVWRHKISVWRTMDVIMPGLVVGQIFGRFGCLAAGCCYGKPTGNSFGIKLYSDLVDKQFQGINLHPTQLYESVALMPLFFGMLYVFRRKSFDGQVGLLYFMGYPIIRSIVEIFRGDLIRGFVIDNILSTSQFISLLVFAVASYALWWRLRQIKTGAAPIAVAVKG